MSAVAGQSLPSVRRYQLLRYPAVPLVTPPSATSSGRRARAPAPALAVNFTALGRRFSLLLTPDLLTLPPGLRLSAPGRAAPPPTLYRGTVDGEDAAPPVCAG